MRNLWIILDDLIQSRQPSNDPEPIRLKLEPVQIEPTRSEYDRAAEAGRIHAMMEEYQEIDKAIRRELTDLEAEYQNATEKRRPVIDRRRLSLLRQRATNTGKFQGLERQMERLYTES